MPDSTPYKFTAAQRKAIGEQVTDWWGSNMQTGFEADGECPVLWVQQGPSTKVRAWKFEQDGTVSNYP
jgi:hypothetical protein